MRSANFDSNVLLVYGEGGHEAQMSRLIRGLSGVNPQNFIALTDSTKGQISCDEFFIVNEVRDKYSRQSFAPLINILFVIKLLVRIRNQYNVKVVISTGPGIGLIAAVFFKFLCGARVIHIETWSRFYSRSLTGRMMYQVADVFYIQNRELVGLYPKAVFSGRL